MIDSTRARHLCYGTSIDYTAEPPPPENCRDTGHRGTSHPARSQGKGPACAVHPLFEQQFPFLTSVESGISCDGLNRVRLLTDEAGDRINDYSGKHGGSSH